MWKLVLEQFDDMLVKVRPGLGRRRRLRPAASHPGRPASSAASRAA
jgi:hypothetical protein